MPDFRASWYSQLPAFGWFDPEDRPGSNALGVPDWKQGIALPSRNTLGQWFNVTAPGGQTLRLQQTDIGPARWTGRGVDISAAAANQFGYSPKTFPTDARFSVEPADGQPMAYEVPQGNKPMAMSFADLFSGQGISGGLGGFGQAIGQNSNALIGMGLGMLSPHRPWAGESPMSAALQGYQVGAQSDALNQYRNQQLQMQAFDRAWKTQEAARAQANADRAFGLQERQFNKPQIHWDTQENPETGEKTSTPYLVSPDASAPAGYKVQRLSPTNAQNLSSTLPTTMNAPAPAAATTDTAAADETAIPPTAQYAQAAPTSSVPADVTRKKEFTTEYAKKRADEEAQAKVKQQEASKVYKLIDQMEDKVRDPLFEEATGPFRGYAGGSSMNWPQRWLYEYGPESVGGSEKAKGLLREIQSNAQAINSTLQNALLKGQGSVTENEREAINKILGDIAGARSPQEAMGLLQNMRAQIRDMMDRGFAVPGAAPPPSQSGGAGDPRDAARQELIRRGVIKQQ